ncbi:exodeoxyribonuclease V subunit gamma [Mizugakiibacter sediminis]|uniref:RecBCD enzyme subunit RecC n=1 Tax=Mizugakiibacter sediminis TaxID=1475481 RepID=A0A0K8QJE0_9GAMM|nr:exodeoxyribonuclease V subunit gamma [Mizugakiibacter sediminis]
MRPALTRDGPTRVFSLLYANDSARLAAALGERLAARARAAPLVPATVLVPQAGLRRWLQVHLAETRGIVANLAFRAPAEFAWDLLRRWRPELPLRSPFEPARLRWHLLALLEAPLDDVPALAPLAAYLADGDAARRFALAAELARAFERYQAYRRERVLAWARGADADDWQAELWRRLLARVGGAHRAALIEDWLAAFQHGGPPPPGLPEHVSAFACGNVSPDVLRMLGVVGRHADVDFYFPTPCREYWGDLPASRKLVRRALAEDADDNPLLLALGGAGAAFVEQLFGYEQVQPEEELDLCDEAIDRRSLLGRVRDDVLARRAPAADARAAPDGSLQFHRCHSPLREVQALHDRLLALIEADPTLTPRDIAVMTPDVAAYRPHVEAVFGGLDERDPRYLPYSIADVPAAATHPALALFARLLDAPASRWTVTEILDVLAVPGVMRRHGLGREGLERVQRWVRESGIRWGADEHARADLGGYREYSWAFGLDRLLAGYAGGDEAALIAGVAPYADIEGAALADLDALLGVLAVWRTLAGFGARRLTAAAWSDALAAQFEALYAEAPDDADEARALRLLRGALAALAEDCAAAGYTAALAWPTVRAFLLERLADADPRQRFFQGGVTVCGMVPLRVVPFRVICLLGMNEDAFPRRDGDSDLDRIAGERRAGQARLGDRSLREDDRFLFLQLLCAARDVFYVSWVGRDPRSHEPRPPAPVVEGLIALLRERYLHAGGEPVLDHPLQPFDARLFDARDDAPLFTYREAWTRAAGVRGFAPVPAFAPAPLPAPPPDDALSDARLKRFFRDPAAAFLRERLGIDLAQARAPDDAEPLAPDDGLLQYQLREALGMALARGEAAEPRTLAPRLRARGVLPPGDFGALALDAAYETAKPLLAALAALTGGAAPQPAAPLSSEIDGAHFAAVLDRCWADTRVCLRPGKLDGRQVIDAWIDHLVHALARGAAARTVLLHLDDKGGAARQMFAGISAEDARAELAALLALRRRGLVAPLPFFPQSSWRCAQRADEREGFAEFEREAKQAQSDYARSEFDDDAVRLAWRGIELPGDPRGELARDLVATARAVFAPVLRALDGAEDAA